MKPDEQDPIYQEIKAQRDAAMALIASWFDSKSTHASIAVQGRNLLERFRDSQNKSQALPARFVTTYCSQCGIDLGPGNSGISSCDQHKQEPV